MVVRALASFSVAGTIILTNGTVSAQENNRVRAVVEAAEEAVIVARLQERLIKIPKRPGEKFNKGDLLIEFDCTELKAKRTVARSLANTKSLDLKNKRKLRRLKAIGGHEVAMAQSQLNEASAEVKVINTQLSHCSISAPFDGQVSEVFANAHETPPQDGRLLSLLGRGPLELRIIVPSKWLSWIGQGTDLQFASDDTGQLYPAKIAAIAGKVDAVSQTIQVIADVENADGRLLPGMSGEAVFSIGESG